MGSDIFLLIFPNSHDSHVAMSGKNPGSFWTHLRQAGRTKIQELELLSSGHDLILKGLTFLQRYRRLRLRAAGWVGC